MINVTKTLLPPIAEYNQQVQGVRDNQWLTNRGKMVVELEDKLRNYLSVSNIIVTNNGIPARILKELTPLKF